MNINVKNFLKKMFYKIGLDVYRFKTSIIPKMQTISALKKKKNKFNF